MACRTIATTPQCANWAAYAGDTNVQLFELVRDGEPWDLTAATVTSHAKEYPAHGGSTVVASAEVLMVDEARGLIEVSWPDLPTEPWEGAWDLQVESSDGIQTVLAGKFTVVPDVTGTMVAITR